MDELTQIALAAGEGDRAALAAFVRATQPEVWRLCRRLGDSHAADDLTQDVYLRAIPALTRFRGEASARTWLLTIARRTIADDLRTRRRRRRHSADPTVELSTPDAAAATGIDLLIADLEPDRRIAFVLTQVHGLSYDEAARVCDCPVGTIRSRVARARHDLITAIHTDDAATGHTP